MLCIGGRTKRRANNEGWGGGLGGSTWDEDVISNWAVRDGDRPMGSMGPIFSEYTLNIHIMGRLGSGI